MDHADRRAASGRTPRGGKARGRLVQFIDGFEAPPWSRLLHPIASVCILPELLQLACKRAAGESKRLRDVVEDALRLYIKAGARKKPYRLQWRTERGTIQPGVDLENRDALFDLMDGKR